MSRPIDHTGKTFGRWTAIERSGSTKSRDAMWLCRCECGTERRVASAGLVHGVSKSCGCLRNERTGAAASRRRIPIGWERRGECFICTSHSAGNHGYPELHFRGKTATIPRLVLSRRSRALPSLIYARHTCDNKLCIRPNHIIPGTHKDNMRDATERHQMQHGEDRPNSKLTAEKVIYIRNSPETLNEISARFDICIATASNIRNRKTWRHIQ